MTKKRFTLDKGIIWENIENMEYGCRFEIFPGKAVDLLNEFYEEKEQLKQEAKHQQGQKQRLRNYLKQYLSMDEIESIINNDEWLDDER